MQKQLNNKLKSYALGYTIYKMKISGILQT